MSLDFSGKVAVVTGAGGGLGRCHALELAKRGAKVVVNDLGGSMDGTGGGSEMANQVVEEIKAAGGEAIANGGSVSDKAGAQSMIKDAMDAWGRVDILVNNAGILRDKSFKKMTVEDFDLVVDVHLRGSAYVTRAAWEIMLEQEFGRIVMTTSPSGLFGNFGQTNYGAAKLGLVGFMNTLKQEGAKYNVFTNAIAPVAMTRMTEGLIPKEMAENLKPEYITNAVVYLCSDEAPNGRIVQAAGPKYFVAEMFENQGATLAQDCTVEDFAANADKIFDMSEAKGRSKAL